MANTTVLDVEADTFITSGCGGCTWGDWSYLMVGSATISGNYYSLLQFDVSSLSKTAIISQATLQVYYTMSGYPADLAMDVIAYRLSHQWDELTATYTNAYDAISESYGMTTIPAESSRGWISLDVTDLCRAWVAGTYGNYGIGLVGHEGPPENYKYLYAREQGVGWGARLEVIWAEPTPIPSDTPPPTDTAVPSVTPLPTATPWPLYLPLLVKDKQMTITHYSGDTGHEGAWWVLGSADTNRVKRMGR